jgi:staphylococcal nuclease domain-containing protein 1
LLVGKLITFDTLYTIPTTKKEYGRVHLPNGPSFPDQLVVEGWAKLRDDAGRKEESKDAVAYLEKLRTLEASAKNASKGVWDSTSHHMKWLIQPPWLRNIKESS